MSDPENQPAPSAAPAEYDGDAPASTEKKEVIATNVTGTVKWFNVKSGMEYYFALLFYGIVHS